MTSILKRTWLFVKRYCKYFVFGIAVVVVILGSYWLKNNAKELELYMKRYEAMKDKQKIDDLIIQKEIIKAKRVYKEEEIKEVDNQINIIKHGIAEDKEAIKKMTIQKRLDEYEKLGY